MSKEEILRDFAIEDNLSIDEVLAGYTVVDWGSGELAVEPKGDVNMKNEEMVTIPKKEYDKLVEDSNWLSCLEGAGVDNWDGISEAYALRREWYGQD